MKNLIADKNKKPQYRGMLRGYYLRDEGGHIWQVPAPFTDIRIPKLY